MERLIQPLTTNDFAPFGQVIEQPSQPEDATGPGWQWWAETVRLEADERPYTVGYLHLRPDELRFDWAERHMRSVEMILPVGGDCLVYVGPPEYLDEPDRLPDLDRFQVFHLRRGQGVILNKGVWHGAPLALEQPVEVVVLLLEDTGRLDTSLVRFTDTPVQITSE
ncbi:MAG: ureidoglycolate lyase [Chloroflexota bacterium]|nr:ureidoglycolate lyase [Chloroflexota bacterium]